MTIRDADRIRDKLEVSLDGRQVFFLFFGGAVVACLVFVLGVMVGKRLEGRERVARKATTSAAVDPLAALDELGADEKAEAPSEDLGFQKALSTRPAAEPPAKPTPPPPPAPKPAPTVAAAAAPAPPAAPPAKPPAPEKPKQNEAQAASAVPPASSSGHFTLQISSFQDRAEADALVAKLGSGGYRPFVIMSDVPDKGTFFRVRLGDFPSRNDALVAKEDFERKQHIIAYVTRI